MRNCIILCSLYELDRINDIGNLAQKCKLPINLSVGIKNKKNRELQQFLDKYGDRLENITYHDNYGVDIAPFLYQLKNVDAEQFPYFIKIHSKKSKWGTKYHVDWGSVLIDSLIGDPQDMHKNLKLLSSDHAGMCCSKFLTLSDNEGSSHNKIIQLCKLLNIDYIALQKYRFAAGSMFMGKTQIYKNILDNNYHVLNQLLQKEIGKVDDRYTTNGTFCHALERIFGYLVTHQNLRILPCILKTYTVYNKQYKKLHLRITYDNYCYLLEDINMYGKIIHKNTESIQIQWFHFYHKPIVTYKYLTPSSITIKQ